VSNESLTPSIHQRHPHASPPPFPYTTLFRSSSADSRKIPKLGTHSVRINLRGTAGGAYQSHTPCRRNVPIAPGAAMRRAVLRPSSVLLALLAAALPAAAQQRLPLDEAYGRLIRAYPTDSPFLSTTVPTLPDHPTVPSPKDHFGVISGAPGVMHTTDELYGYYRALAAATPRVRVETIGTTEEGREILLVIVADEQTMQRLDHYRAQLARLADPRALPATEVDAVIADAKPIDMLHGGPHSPEMGPPEMLPELAYRLAVSDDPDVERIRNEVITIINPV